MRCHVVCVKDILSFSVWSSHDGSSNDCDGYTAERYWFTCCHVLSYAIRFFDNPQNMCNIEVQLSNGYDMRYYQRCWIILKNQNDCCDVGCTSYHPFLHMLWFFNNFKWTIASKMNRICKYVLAVSFQASVPWPTFLHHSEYMHCVSMPGHDCIYVCVCDVCVWLCSGASSCHVWIQVDICVSVSHSYMATIQFNSLRTTHAVILPVGAQTHENYYWSESM